jgi:hypothetical protein
MTFKPETLNRATKSSAFFGFGLLFSVLRSKIGCKAVKKKGVRVEAGNFPA